MSVEWNAWLSAALGSGLGAFLGSYLRRKGEHLATHEDISKLVDQVEATTEATKAIEARIDSDLWDRQKLWEMKRDALVTALNALSCADDKLISLCNVFAKDRNPRPAPDIMLQVSDDFQREMLLFDTRSRIVGLVCDKQTAGVFLNAAKEMRLAANGAMSGNLRTYLDVAETIQRAIHEAFQSARRELGVIPQSPHPQLFPQTST